MSNDHRLRTTFDNSAALYQDARPDYPAELFCDLVAITGIEPPAHLLEVGCGPGKAALPLAQMGFRITAVELGDALAAQARHNLADFPEAPVVTSSFEDWEPPTGVRFDLVYAATALIGAYELLMRQIRHTSVGKAERDDADAGVNSEAPHRTSEDADRTSAATDGSSEDSPRDLHSAPTPSAIA